MDYSPTLSDVGALLYLASNPAVELLAVTLPGTGEADCVPGLRITRSLLTIAGREGVPTGCGRNTPLTGDRDWPEEWRTEVNGWGNEMPAVAEEDPAVAAEQLLTETLRTASAPVTLVAVGPLTNLGVVLADEPELADRVERVVIMGGAVTVPGNVQDSPAAEWNIYIDPEAARRVIAAGIAVTLVPLDATNHVPWTDRLLSRLGALDSEAAHEVHRLATSRGSLEGFYLWDELAAMAAVEPSLATIESMTVSIDDEGAILRDASGFAVDVAISADADLAIGEFVAALNGGTAPPMDSLTAAELDYFVRIGGASSRSNAATSHAFQRLDESNPNIRGMATIMLNDFIDATEQLAVELRSISAPSALLDQHARYVESLSALVERRDEALDVLFIAEGTTVDELFNNSQMMSVLGDTFDRIGEACQALVDYSFVRGGPRPCDTGN